MRDRALPQGVRLIQTVPDPADRVIIHAVPGGHSSIRSKNAGGSRPISGRWLTTRPLGNVGTPWSREDRPEIQGCQSWVQPRWGGPSGIRSEAIPAPAIALIPVPGPASRGPPGPASFAGRMRSGGD